jgi:dihydroxyacetone kinase
LKKLINAPERVVEEMLDGMVAIDPRLKRLPGRTVVVRDDPGFDVNRRVALISGGGSGHEPAHAGYVGQGMLSAAVAGGVFASPGPDAVLAAIRAVTGRPGAILIVKNYTGDRLNFGLAAERARAEGLNVETLIVADDAALTASGDHAGRRGLAGTVLVHKIAGASAESGAPLAEVVADARAAAELVRTMGVALTPCTIPAAGRPGFSLGDDEIELGLGIHGEPGVRRGPLEPADALVDSMLATILTDARLSAGARVVLLVNNLGGTPTMELAIVARHAIARLESEGLAVERVFCGTFLSALEMAGVSLSVLPVNDRRLALLDAPTEAPAWRHAPARTRRSRSDSDAPVPQTKRNAPPQTSAGRTLERAILAVVSALDGSVETLAELDRHAGDGDFGESVARGTHALVAALRSYDLDNPAAAFEGMSLTLQDAMGGTSGALYGVMLLRAGMSLRNAPTDDLRTWALAFCAACEGVASVGGARPGDRTMLDALSPASDAFSAAVIAGQSQSDALRLACSAAREGASRTASMEPRRGRASYLGRRALGHADPGAAAIAVWLEAVASVLGDPTAA